MVPVHQEASLERLDHFVTLLWVCILPVADGAFADIPDTDVNPAEEPDLPVDNQDLPGVSEGDP